MGEGIMAGAWKTNITAPVGTSMAADFQGTPSQGIAGELYAHALVIDDGKTEAVLISADVCFIPDHIIKDIQAKIQELCGIPADNILIAATHTHNGPMLEEEMPGNGVLPVHYIENFKNLATSAAVMAQKNKQPVRIRAGRGSNDRHVFNRRMKKPDGSIVMNWVDPGFLKDCVPSGPADPEILVAGIYKYDGSPLAFIVNYAVHNNAGCGPGMIGPDFSGYMAGELSKIFGRDVVTLFLAGACGNTNWIDCRDEDWTKRQKLWEKIGTALTGSVLEILADMEELEVCDIGVLHRSFTGMERPFCDYDTKNDITFGPLEESGDNDFLRLYAEYRMKYEDRPLSSQQVDVSVLRLGRDLGIAANPAELFTEFGLRMKAESPFKYSMVSELTNGYIGYIPTIEAFTEGGYEVKKIHKNSFMEKNTGDRLTEITVNMLKAL